MVGPGGETSESGSAPFTVVYAFAGPSRYCDIRSCLEKLIPGICVGEFDICRDDKQDLTQDSVWEEIFRLVAKPRTVFITNPPCNTHSRAWRRKPGPQPLRSSVWPRGFPSLTPTKATAVEDANFMIDSSIKASMIAAEAGNSFLWEHPENLGVAADGVIPASIWDMPEVLDLLPKFHAISFALFQSNTGRPAASLHVSSLVSTQRSSVRRLMPSFPAWMPMDTTWVHCPKHALAGPEMVHGPKRQLSTRFVQILGPSRGRLAPEDPATAPSHSQGYVRVFICSHARCHATGFTEQTEELRGTECLEPLCLPPQCSQSEPNHDAAHKTLPPKPVGLGFRPQNP